MLGVLTSRYVSPRVLCACAAWIGVSPFACGGTVADRERAEQVPTPTPTAVPPPGPPRPPPVAQSFLELEDEDPRIGHLAGTLSLDPAPFPDDRIVAYDIFWGADATTPVGAPIMTVPASPTMTTHAFDAPFPAGTTHLLSVARTVSTQLAPRGFQFADAKFLGLGGGFTGLGNGPPIAVDEAGRTLFLLGTTNGNVFILFRCSLDGGICARVELNTPPDLATGRAALGVVGNQVFVATRRSSVSAIVLMRCEKDGTGCSSSDLPTCSTGGGALVQELQAVGSSFVIVSSSAGGTRVCSCALDGSTCAASPTYAEAASLASGASLLHDTTNGKILVVTDTGVLRCEQDGTGCVLSDYRAGHVVDSARGTVDLASGRLLVVARVAGAVRLFRCALDVTACTSVEIVNGPFKNPDVVVDAAGDAVLVTVADGGNVDERATVWRCSREGTECKPWRLSAKRSVYDVTPWFDPVLGRLHVAALAGDPALFSLGPWP